MSLTEIRTEIKTELESVSGVKNVHDYRRRVNDWSKIESEFKSGNLIHTWIMKYMGSPFEFDTDSEGYLANRSFEIWGLYSLSDANASEKDFDDIVEAVEDHFANLRVLKNNGRYKIAGITTAMDEYSFVNVLCNRCIFTLEIQELQSYV